MIDLNHLEKYTENNRIEAKKALGGLPHSIWETYSAFANTLGGIILLGVEEYKDKTLHTVNLPDPEELIRQFLETLNDPAKTSVNLLTDKHIRIEEVNGDHIIVIEVPRAQRYNKPVYVDGNPVSGIYRRNGEGDYHCTEEEILAMKRDADIRTQDMLILENMDCSVFCTDSIRNYRQHMKNSRPNHVWENLDDSEFLIKLSAAGIGEDGRIHPTSAGLLMFGYEHEILREYPNYSLAYHEEFDSVQQQTDRFHASSVGWSGNVLDFFFHVYGKLQAALEMQFEIHIDDTPLQKAIREALANCLVNADYYGCGGLVITRKQALITLSNPGDFRVELTEAQSGGMSDPRNGIMMKMFNLIDIGERAGSGIPSIWYAWKQQGWNTPAIAQSFNPNRIVLSLPLKKSTDKTMPSGIAESDSADKNLPIRTAAKKDMIITCLTDNGTATVAELCTLLDLNPDRVRTILHEMIAEGIVAAQGEDRNRSYKLKA